jgi:hypothetical protein
MRWFLVRHTDQFPALTDQNFQVPCKHGRDLIESFHLRNSMLRPIASVLGQRDKLQDANARENKRLFEIKIKPMAETFIHVVVATTNATIIVPTVIKTTTATVHAL